MHLSAAQISENYKKSIDLASQLIRQKFRQRGYDQTGAEAFIVELSQTVIGSEEIVKLIQTHIFNPKEYQPEIENTIELCKKELFLDVQKKRFISIYGRNWDIPEEELVWEQEHEDQIKSTSEIKSIIKKSEKHLSKSNITYLKKIAER